jgi:hypothetical protein
VHRPRIAVSYVAQNGATRQETLMIKAPCGGKVARHKRHHR